MNYLAVERSRCNVAAQSSFFSSAHTLCHRHPVSSRGVRVPTVSEVELGVRTLQLLNLTIVFDCATASARA